MTDYRESALDVLLLMTGQGILHCTPAAETDTEAADNQRELALKTERAFMMLGFTYPELIAASHRVRAISEEVQLGEALADEGAIDAWLNPNGEQA